jgi:hypothetical protein
MDPDQPITFRATPTKQQVKVAVRAVSGRTLRIVRLIALGLAAIGVVEIVAGHGALDPGGQLIFYGLLLGLLAPWFSVFRSTRVNFRVIGRPTTYRVGADGAQAINDQSETLIRWSMVTGADEFTGLLVVRCGRSRFVLLPTAGLASEATAALTRYVREHLGHGGPPAPAAPSVPAAQPVLLPARPVPPGDHAVRPPTP